jgi:hypothetical protein
MGIRLAAIGLLSLLASVLVPLQAQGAGDLLVNPTRIVFEGRKRAAELNLSNVGLAKGVYRVTLVRMEMTETGGFHQLPTERVPGQVAPEDLVRFSPREVTLDPQESQTVRLQLRKPADLPPGEYRIHMAFQSVPPVPEAQAPAEAGSGKGLSIKLTPVFGLAIPIIIRQGETAATASLADLAYDSTRREIHFTLQRQGNQSVYGDLKATFKPASGKEEEISEANGVAVYTPNPLRRMVLSAPIKAKGPGRIHLTYARPDADSEPLMAEAFLDLP